ncbi:MAG: hypothetical protein E6Z60_14640 [Mixta calida]|uniref:hypothetical protein n=1 Tax=Mixta calida TaxID=665913 RepID=UPI0028A2693D|nr:hypothetical protein [Mixta calida]MDU5828138.1 hypothetical protein [Mixta calida]
MNTLINLFAGGWNYILAGLAVVAALVATYFGGKKVAKTEEKAKAEVADAIRMQHQAEAKSDVEAYNIQSAKEAQQSNASLSDDAARRKLRESKYHTDD